MLKPMEGQANRMTSSVNRHQDSRHMRRSRSRNAQDTEPNNPVAIVRSAPQIFEAAFQMVIEPPHEELGIIQSWPDVITKETIIVEYG
jgi:hypothetical protein